MAELKICFVGAGAVNFGEAACKTPWDHASRLEQLAAVHPLRIVGIADPLTSKAEEQLTARKAGAAPHLWADCGIYADVNEMLATCKPDAVFVGVPPVVHGSLSNGRDVELRILKAGSAVFVEKPISCLPLTEVLPYAEAMKEAAGTAGLPVSVGYMFRYSKPAQKIRALIAEHAAGKVCCFNARYNAAYAAIPHRFWWTTSRSGGPLVEQATHFIDLARFLCGEVDSSTISGLGIGPSSELGQLTQIPAVVEEGTIPEADRIPRASIVTWRFGNGGLGVLNHALLRQGTEYENGITIWADGLSIEWLSPYTPACRLEVKIGAPDDIQTITFPEDDMYYTQDKTFLEAVLESKKKREEGSAAGLAFPNILSSYEDGVKTFVLSTQLRDSIKV